MLNSRQNYTGTKQKESNAHPSSSNSNNIYKLRGMQKMHHTNTSTSATEPNKIMSSKMKSEMGDDRDQVYS